MRSGFVSIFILNLASAIDMKYELVVIGDMS